MLRKKVDNRIRILIENGVAERHRTLVVVVGDHGKDQVVILHHMLSKATVKARPSVLWCYKKELGFSSHRKKRMRQLQKKIKTGMLDLKQDDPFELFIAATNIRYCYYNETHKILGNTFGMCVLQDFEALTPNLLARTVETVEGGGIVAILLRTMNSLKQLYTMTMDVHSRYRTEAHQDVVGRFNERFILSLASCKTCMVVDDQLNILPISSHVANIVAIPPRSQEDSLSPQDMELKDLKESLQDTQPVGVLVDRCKTLDQAKAVLKFIEAISEKTLRSTVALTAARGRTPTFFPDNLQTLFEFIFKGFDALQYQEHLDYEIIQSLNPEFSKAVVRVNVFKEHRQTIQYIHPADAVKLGQAELVVIDEAAAIPLPLVKSLLGPYLGTGRSLSLKLIQQLRQQSAQAQASVTAENKMTTTTKLSSARTLHEVSLQESIRYAPGDPVEKWLNDLLCLECLNISRILSGCPLPETCDLYYVNRDTLFCYHRASEAFLQRLMALYVASHYKNSPNDLQMLSDAPAHHLFCLLPPVQPTQNSLPEVLAVVQVCLEGEISRQSIMNSLSRGKKASGDLIPWSISEQFQDPDFGSLSGGRIVRIAVHPDYQGMGYGSRALRLLQMYYEGKFPCLEEKVTPKPKGIATVSSEAVSLLEEAVMPRKDLPPLLLKLSERQAESLDYLGVSYGLTPRLLKFWKKGGFVPVYLRQTPNDLTGEHSCIMLKVLNEEEDSEQENWLTAFWKDFRRRFLSLLSYQFSTFSPSLALNILQNRNIKKQSQPSSPFPLNTVCRKSEDLDKKDLHSALHSEDQHFHGFIKFVLSLIKPGSNQLCENFRLVAIFGNWIGKVICLSFSLFNFFTVCSVISRNELDAVFIPYDLKRLEMYSRNMVDYHLIMDMIPSIARMYFLKQLGDMTLSATQSALLLGIGLQHKTLDQLEKEIELPSGQLMGLFNRSIRKIVQLFNTIQERAVEEQMTATKEVEMEPTLKSLNEDLEEAAREFQEKHKQDIGKLKDLDLSQYVIRGDDEEWNEVLSRAGQGASVVSLKRQRVSGHWKRQKCLSNSSKKSLRDGTTPLENAPTPRPVCQQKPSVKMSHEQWSWSANRHGKRGRGQILNSFVP
ncbi:RNA cytidine acetyltransferase [Varanus komodoensis]|nr:RNA cytidine acetyltransferase [Varanus komodoensis]